MNLDMDRQIREVAAVCDYVQGAAALAQASLAVVRRVERLVPRPQRRRRERAAAVRPQAARGGLQPRGRAVVAGGFLNTLMRQSDRVRVACLAQIVNVIAPLVTNSKGVLRQSIYFPYLMALKYARGRMLDLQVESETYPSSPKACGRISPVTQVPFLDVVATVERRGPACALC